MKLVECERCGSKELIEANKVVTCAYCQSRFVTQVDDLPLASTVIGVDADVQELLRKCREDPLHRRQFANLVLDIDPTNREAMAYLSQDVT